jgi:hypothetical protein
MYSLIQATIHDQADADSSANRDQQKGIGAAPGAPSPLAQGGSVGIIFDRDADIEYFPQLLNQVDALPAGKKSVLPQRPATWVNRPGATDADPLHPPLRCIQTLPQAGDDFGDAIRWGFSVRGSREFLAGEDVTLRVHQAESDFRASNVNCSDHAIIPSAFSLISLW